MQDLARITGRALHQHWQDLMEVPSPNSSSRSGSGSGDGGKSKCSLVVVMLNDPSAKASVPPGSVSLCSRARTVRNGTSHRLSARQGQHEVNML